VTPQVIKEEVKKPALFKIEPLNLSPPVESKKVPLSRFRSLD
jgi:hypothetical protein